MAEGKDKIARSLLDLQPTAIVDFYKIYPDIINKPTLSIDIHGGSIFNDAIVWQGVKYAPVPIEAEGFEITSNGRLPRPKIRVANKDYLMTNLLQNNFDFKNAQIIRKRTFVKYLDDENFDGGNPFGEADATAEISEEKYVVGQKTQENKIMVELELTSPLDLENFELNHRRILGKYCYWMYRGEGCGYQGVPIQRENGQNFTDSDGNIVTPDISNFRFDDAEFAWYPTTQYQKSDIVYIENPKILVQSTIDGISYPIKIWYVCVADNIGQNPENNPTYWQKDGCNKKLSSCKLRFGQTLKFDAEIVTREYINISGYKESSAAPYINTGYFASQEPDLTGFYTGDFTIALLVDGDYSRTVQSACYIDTTTGELVTGNSLYVSSYSSADNLRLRTLNTNADNTIIYRSDLQTSLDPKIRISDMGRTLLIWQQKYNATAYELMYLKKNNGYKSLTTAISYSRSKFYWNTNALILGANVSGSNFESPDQVRSPNAKYYNLAIWDRFLSDNQIVEMMSLEQNTQNVILKSYSDLSVSEKTNLLAWYENTAVKNVGGQNYTVFEDSHTNGYDLTGYGQFETGSEPLRFVTENVIAQPIEYYSLPFGGFPGTDGFSFQA